LALANLVDGLVSGCAAWRDHVWVKLLVDGVIVEINPSDQELRGAVLPVRDDRVHPRAHDRDRPAARPPRPAVHDTVSRELKLLVDHRDNLVAERTRMINRLRWHLHGSTPSWNCPHEAWDGLAAWTCSHPGSAGSQPPR
jgi:hypothetical protein